MIDDDRLVVELWVRKRTIASALLGAEQPLLVASALISGEEFVHIAVDVADEDPT